MIMKNFTFIDWWKPFVASIVTTSLVLAWHGSANLDLLKVEEIYLRAMPLSFSYASTLLGLLISAFTILQSLDNEIVRKIRSWAAYKRYKNNLLITLLFLVILAVLSAIAIFSPTPICIIAIQVVLHVVLFLITFTLISIYLWIRLLIKHLT
jgi:hypothetical protein